MQGRLFAIQRFSLDDGPGIRSIVFLKGCNLRCPWCHNPESLSSDFQLMKIESLCLSCGRCEKACPHNAIASHDDNFEISRDDCTLCMECVRICPSGSLKISGYDMDSEDVLKTLLKDRLYYEESGGGVTFSGGEPTMQADFLIEMLQLCKSNDLHTCIETNGCFSEDLLPVLSPLLDYVMIDCKHVDDEKHRRFTGFSASAAKRSIAYFVKHNSFTEIRIPVIPGFNDSIEELQAILDFLHSCAAKSATLLPYHSFAVSKYKNLSMPYDFAGIEDTQTAKLNDMLSSLNCHDIGVSVSEK